jgi:putative salt-induced outer membrane protein YdiY
MRYLLLAFLLCAAAAAGDEVKLVNGDRITGKVTGLAGGKLTIDTPHAGKVTIDFAQVASITTETKHKVRMATGEEVEGTLKGEGGKLKVASEGAAAPVEVEFAKITHFNKPPTSWKGSLSLAARSTDGNTHTISGLASADLSRTSEIDEFIIRAIYRYGETEGVLTERNAYGLGKYSYKFTERFFGFASVELFRDDFKDLDLRSIAAAGLGYDVIKESWIDFSMDAGLMYVDNNFHELEEDESHAGMRYSAKARVDLPLGFVLKDVFTLYTNFEESQDFQIRNELTLANTLGAGWSVIGGVITEYDRVPGPGLRRHDDTYFIGIGYAF